MGSLPAGNGQTTAVFGSDGWDFAATFASGVPYGTKVIETNCDHTDMACLLAAVPKSLAGGACSAQLTVSRGVGGTSGLVPSGDPTMAVAGVGLGSDFGWLTEAVSSTIYFDGGGGDESVTSRIFFDDNP